jgi:hypothetical protein
MKVQVLYQSREGCAPASPGGAGWVWFPGVGKLVPLDIVLSLAAAYQDQPTARGDILSVARLQY